MCVSCRSSRERMRAASWGMLTQRDVLREVAQPSDRDLAQRTAPAPVRRLVGAVEIEAPRRARLNRRFVDGLATTATGVLGHHRHPPKGRCGHSSRQRPGLSRTTWRLSCRSRPRKPQCERCSSTAPTNRAPVGGSCLTRQQHPTTTRRRDKRHRRPALNAKPMLMPSSPRLTQVCETVSLDGRGGDGRPGRGECSRRWDR